MILESSLKKGSGFEGKRSREKPSTFFMYKNRHCEEERRGNLIHEVFFEKQNQYNYFTSAPLMLLP